MSPQQFIDKGAESQAKINEAAKVTAKNMLTDLAFLRDYFYLQGGKKTELLACIDMLEICEALK